MNALLTGIVAAGVIGIFALSLGGTMWVCNKVEKYHHGFWSATIALMYIGFFVGLAIGRNT